MKIKNIQAIRCMKIQDGRHTNMKNLCLLINLKKMRLEDSFWCLHIGFQV